MSSRMPVRIDLGCGARKEEGFIGLDRSPAAGVDIVADLDADLPLADDCVDCLVASHSLEHVRDLMHAIREIYRVCRHGAAICIVAPYNEQKLSLANPYHLGAFNEHTPRFWTTSSNVAIDLDEYRHPHALQWGLADSGGNSAAVDLRLVHMEFFYFPDYRGLSPERQRQLRRERLDVCDQIVYHLVAWKPNSGTGLSAQVTGDGSLAFVEPAYIARRRAADLSDGMAHAAKRIEALQNRLDVAERRESAGVEALGRALQAMINDHLLRGEKLAEDLRSELAEVRTSIAAQTGRVEVLAGAHEENRRLHDQLLSAERERMRASLIDTELEAANGLLAWYRAREEEAHRHAAEANSADAVRDAADWRDAGDVVGNLMAQAIAGRWSLQQRLMVWLRRHDPLWDAIAPGYNGLRAYTEGRFRDGHAWRLQLSVDLRTVPFREYRIESRQQTLSCLGFAIRPLLRARAGVVGIEIVSHDERIIAQTMLPLANLDPFQPAEFMLSEVLGPLFPGWRVRVFVRDAPIPVAVYEIARPRLLRPEPVLAPFAIFR
ncbi:MAG: methyltransferase domain-containing protein [Burkholderiales bacterium]|nr:methyltransferase domain-containing protein [Burkholderiales bacterium]